MNEEERKGKRNEKRLGIFLLIMIILFIGIACVISYIAGCIVTERKYVRESIVQELNKQQEEVVTYNLTGGREYE